MRSTTIIDGTATVGKETSLGEFCVIEPDVVIGAGCKIGHHVIIRRGTRIGDGVRIDDGASIGKQPMRSVASATTSSSHMRGAVIEDGVIVGSGAVVYAGCHVREQVMIADLATVREDVEVGEKTIIGRGVAIENKCTIGRHCKIETNAYITAYSTIGDHVFVAPGVLTSNDAYLGRTEERFAHFGGVDVRRGGRIGVGAIILPNRTIAEESVIGAGSVLTHDAYPGKVYLGAPARPTRDVPDEQKLKE